MAIRRVRVRFQSRTAEFDRRPLHLKRGKPKRQVETATVRLPRYPCPPKDSAACSCPYSAGACPLPAPSPGEGGVLVWCRPSPARKRDALMRPEPGYQRSVFSKRGFQTVLYSTRAGGGNCPVIART